MFAGLAHLGSLGPPPDTSAREVPPPTKVSFPKCTPLARDGRSRDSKPIVSLLQSIHRPLDVRLSHFNALGLHVQNDTPAQALLPDASFLPPLEEWCRMPTERLMDVNESTRRPLNNGSRSPGIQTYRERRRELLTDNIAAFRTIRRITPSGGESAARLGNAYEFFKNLEFFSAFWLDTSLSHEAASIPTPDTPAPSTEIESMPTHPQTHVRSGTGSQMPPEYRQNLLSSFIKLVAYDFGCNVHFSRVEPRLHLTPSSNASSPSYFNSSASFIFRTPVDRSSARAGIVEGPVAALSSRNTTIFATEHEEQLDLAREMIAMLLTAQHRAREHKREIRFGEDKWWTSRPRWGGGPGGRIGRESDDHESQQAMANPPTNLSPPSGSSPHGKQSSKSSSNDISPSVLRPNLNPNPNPHPNPSPNKRPRRLKNGNMAIYQPYRRMTPPSSTWDRKARYSTIGKVPGSPHDDIFLVSALNHHICILRARVPDALMRVLDGAEEKKTTTRSPAEAAKQKGSAEEDEDGGEVEAGEDWERLAVWRSRWYDMFLKEDRAEAMGVVWGMMAWLMREVRRKDEGGEQARGGKRAARGDGGEKMDLS